MRGGQGQTFSAFVAMALGGYAGEESKETDAEMDRVADGGGASSSIAIRLASRSHWNAKQRSQAATPDSSQPRQGGRVGGWA